MISPYDTVDYKGYAYLDTDPRSLSAVGCLMGLAPAAPLSCRVLEIGCGDGINLVSMACSAPGSSFMGIDLSKRTIEKGIQLARNLRLDNLAFIQADLLNIDIQSLGSFDYIVSHGLYSWVEPQVRDRLMELVSRTLAPSGIAFVSFNALPGFHLREMVRSMLRLHTRAAASQMEMIEQSRAFAEFLSIGCDADGPERLAMRAEAEKLLAKDDGAIFHDDLADINTPVFFHEFVEHAGRHGLAFLAEAGAGAVAKWSLPPEVLEMLNDLDPLTREQYRDFFLCRRFRRSLLVRQDAEINSQPYNLAVSRLWFASMAQRLEGTDGARLYRVKSGAQIETDDHHICATLDVLVDSWPAAVSFADIINALGKNDSEAFVAETLMDAAGMGLVKFVTTPPVVSIRYGEYPRAFPLAREQVQTGRVATNLWHDPVIIDDNFALRLLPLLDGTRSIDQLAQDMQEEGTELGEQREKVTLHLKHLVRLGLLVA